MEYNLDNLKVAVDKFGIETVSDIIYRMKSVGAYSSGRLAKSLKVDLSVSNEQLGMSIEALDYFDNIEYGRKPGRYPNITAIQQWCKVKGIPINRAFPIARSIYRYGIKPRPVLSEVLKSNKFKDRYEVIGDAYKKDIEASISKIVININK